MFCCGYIIKGHNFISFLTSCSCPYGDDITFCLIDVGFGTRQNKGKHSVLYVTKLQCFSDARAPGFTRHLYPKVHAAAAVRAPENSESWCVGSRQTPSSLACCVRHRHEEKSPEVPGIHWPGVGF